MRFISLCVIGRSRLICLRAYIPLLVGHQASLGEQHSVGMYQDFAALAQFRDSLPVDVCFLIGLIKMPATDQICRLPVELVVAAFPLEFAILTYPILLHYITAL